MYNVLQYKKYLCTRCKHNKLTKMGKQTQEKKIKGGPVSGPVLGQK